MEAIAKLFVLFVAIGFIVACREEKSLIERIQAAGLEVENARTLAASELPPGATEGQAFIIPSHCADCGGKILGFTRAADARKMGDLWGGMGHHVYMREGVLLQINAKIDKPVADRYGEVLLK